MEWLIVLAVVALGSAIGLSFRKKEPKLLSAGTKDWKTAFEEISPEVGGRFAAASGSSQLRAEFQHLTVTFKAEGETLTAEAALYPGAENLRVFLGAQGAAPPSDFSHVPERELPPAYSLDPPVTLQADDESRGVEFATEAAPVLNRAIRDIRPKSYSVLIRGGTLKLTVQQGRPSKDGVLAAARGVAELCAHFGGDLQQAAKQAPQLPSGGGKVTCTFCGGERRPGVDWVRCRTCRAPHHKECWDSAQHCSRSGCESVISESFGD